MSKKYISIFTIGLLSIFIFASCSNNTYEEDEIKEDNKLQDEIQTDEPLTAEEAKIETINILGSRENPFNYTDKITFENVLLFDSSYNIHGGTIEFSFSNISKSSIDGSVKLSKCESSSTMLLTCEVFFYDSDFNQIGDEFVRGVDDYDVNLHDGTSAQITLPLSDLKGTPAYMCMVMTSDHEEDVEKNIWVKLN